MAAATKTVPTKTVRLDQHLRGKHEYEPGETLAAIVKTAEIVEKRESVEPQVDIDIIEDAKKAWA